MKSQWMRFHIVDSGSQWIRCAIRIHLRVYGVQEKLRGKYGIEFGGV